ncbi:MAG: hypothetical protein Q9M89_07315 [Persephonella sp.]|nr:hypothetical protein [Persephonella sp.]
MWDKVGIFREEKPMQEAIEKIKELKERYKNLAPGDSGKLFNTALINYLELGYLLDLAEVIAHNRRNEKRNPEGPTQEGITLKGTTKTS